MEREAFLNLEMALKTPVRCDCTAEGEAEMRRDSLCLCWGSGWKVLEVWHLEGRHGQPMFFPNHRAISFLGVDPKGQGQSMSLSGAVVLFVADLKPEATGCPPVYREHTEKQMAGPLCGNAKNEHSRRG